MNWVVLSCAILGMGLGMPGCPNQEMQQQMEILRNNNTDLSKKIQALSTQITTLNNDLIQIKQLLPEMTGVMTLQKNTMKELDDNVKELQAKVFKGVKKKK